MKNKFILIITYILIFFNSNLLCDEKNNTLKVGLLAPLSGEYKELGESLLYSLQLALDEINDTNVVIVPRDSGFNDKKKLENAVKEIKSQGANVIIGPMDINKPAIFDWIYCSAQLIKKNGIKLPIIPTAIKTYIFSFEKLILYPLK